MSMATLPDFLKVSSFSSATFKTLLNVLGSPSLPFYTFGTTHPTQPFQYWTTQLAAALGREVRLLKDEYGERLKGLTHLECQVRNGKSGVEIVAWFSFGDFLRDTLGQMHQEFENSKHPDRAISSQATPMELQDLFFYLVGNPSASHVDGSLDHSELQEDALKKEMREVIDKNQTDAYTRAYDLIVQFGLRVIHFALKNHFLPHANRLLDAANRLEPALLPLASAFSDWWTADAQVVWYTYVARCATYLYTKDVNNRLFLSHVTEVCKARIAQKPSMVQDARGMVKYLIKPKDLHDWVTLSMQPQTHDSLGRASRPSLSARKEGIYQL